MEVFSSYAHRNQYLEWEIQEDLLHCHHLHPSFYLFCHLFFFYLQNWMVMCLLLHHVIKWGGVGVGEVFLNTFLNKNANAMQFSILKWNMPNANIFCFCRKKRNESTRKENNGYFDTLPTMMPKSDQPQCCNKNVATPKCNNFNYEPEVHRNLRGIGTICATYNVSLFSWSNVMEWMSWNQALK